MLYVDLYLGKADLERRLSRTEDALAALQARFPMYDITERADAGENVDEDVTYMIQESSNETPLTQMQQNAAPPSDLARGLSRLLHRRKRAPARKRKSKKCKRSRHVIQADQTKSRTARSHTCPPSVPNFYMKGNGKEEFGEFRFLWDGSGGIHASENGPFTPQTDGGQVNRVHSVQITHTGVYFIYIQIKVHGRSQITSNNHPSVGFSLKTNNNNRSLAKAILTQDERGDRYPYGGSQWPVDTLSLSGIFFLERNEVLTVTPLQHQLTDTRIQYKNEADSSYFGGFMLEKSGC